MCCFPGSQCGEHSGSGGGGCRCDPLRATVTSLLSGLARDAQTAWWKYALLAFTDVQGNYLVVKAYQYTSITSVMLLDCFTIPFAMALSRLFLRTRVRALAPGGARPLTQTPRRAQYSLVHLGGVALCLAGLVLLIVSDAGSLSARGASGRNALVGDLLCIAGSFLYAVTNVGQEALVKRFDKVGRRQCRRTPQATLTRVGRAVRVPGQHRRLRHARVVRAAGAAGAQPGSVPGLARPGAALHGGLRGLPVQHVRVHVGACVRCDAEDPAAITTRRPAPPARPPVRSPSSAAPATQRC